MNPTRLLLLGLLLAGKTASQALNVPGADGAHGAFAPAGNTTVNLATEGEYDPGQWAVIFRYSAVDIPAGVTVKFQNHPSRAPVVWLVNGDVTINGTLDLSGSEGDSAATFRLSEPGPGGFRGADVDLAINDAGPGFGPGGGTKGGPEYEDYIGAYGTSLSPLVPTYGNVQIIPLMGGSGGAGFYTPHFAGVGAAGGGAILIAATGRITIGNQGAIQANGGLYRYPASGGAVRLVAEVLAGGGAINAIGGTQGRVRLEANTDLSNLSVLPMTQLSPAGATAVLWPAPDAPTVRVLSVAGQTAPLDPRASLGPAPADMTAPVGGTADILLETKNLPPTGTVRVRIAARASGPATFVDAIHESGDAALSTWRASFTVPTGFFALQARATALATP